MAIVSMDKGTAKQMAWLYFPSFLRSRTRAKRVQAWIDGQQYNIDVDADDPMYGRAFAPVKATVDAEFENLRSLSPNAFAGLIVTSLGQTSHLTGIRRPGQDTLPVWDTFQANRWDSRQTPIHRCAIGHGVAYGVVLPGANPLTGIQVPKMIGKSPERMAAFYDLEDDEFPEFAIEAEPQQSRIPGTGNTIADGWKVKIWDVGRIHNLKCKGDGTGEDDWEYVGYELHGMPVVPVARLINRVDLEGRTQGEIEPVLPILRRIDQDLFDRLIKQRFGAWQVRYIAGMAKPTSQNAAAAEKLRLSVEDILVSTNADTKFGVLPADGLEGQMGATDADLRLLSAITQMPPHHLLGLSSNLQAEALAAAEAGLQRKSNDFRTNAGEFHEQMARLAAMYQGDLVTAAATDLQVRWRDTESRSFAQTAQALGILATQLKVPLEMLWEEIPNWTDTDVKRATDLVENGSIQALLEEFMGGQDQGGTGGSDNQQ